MQIEFTLAGRRRRVLRSRIIVVAIDFTGQLRGDKPTVLRLGVGRVKPWQPIKKALAIECHWTTDSLNTTLRGRKANLTSKRCRPGGTAKHANFWKSCGPLALTQNGRWSRLIGMNLTLPLRASYSRCISIWKYILNHRGRLS